MVKTVNIKRRLCYPSLSFIDCRNEEQSYFYVSAVVSYVLARASLNRLDLFDHPLYVSE